MDYIKELEFQIQNLKSDLEEEKDKVAKDFQNKLEECKQENIYENTK